MLCFHCYRRNFTTAGAAAGVAAAFGAPVGGLLFAMEEVSSFWSMKLGWMIFFSCMLATFTADLLNSSFEAFHFSGWFGLFHTNKYIIFKVSASGVASHSCNNPRGKQTINGWGTLWKSPNAVRFFGWTKLFSIYAYSLLAWDEV